MVKPNVRLSRVGVVTIRLILFLSYLKLNFSTLMCFETNKIITSVSYTCLNAGRLVTCNIPCKFQFFSFQLSLYSSITCSPCITSVFANSFPVKSHCTSDWCLHPTWCSSHHPPPTPPPHLAAWERMTCPWIPLFHSLSHFLLTCLHISH